MAKNMNLFDNIVNNMEIKHCYNVKSILILLIILFVIVYNIL